MLVSLNITAMFTPHCKGGVATHVDYLSRSLNKLKTSSRHKIHVVTVHHDTATKGIVTHGSKKPNLHVHRVNGKNSHFEAEGSIPYESTIRHCMKLCNDPRTKPDVIHVHDFEGVHIASLLKAVYKIPIILTIHKTPKEWDETKIKYEPKDFHLQAITRMDLFDYFVAPSEAYKKHLVDHGVKKEKIKVIMHGVVENYLKGKNENNIFTRMKIRGGQDIIFAPIRLDKHKGPDVFIEAASKVIKKTKNRKLLFIIAGTGSEKYTNDLNDLSRKLKIQDQIIIGPPDRQPPTLNEMASLYQRSKICVLPSRREGFGQVILESFVFGKPIIGSNVGGIKEIISPEKNGLLFDSDEPDKLAEKIILLLENKTLLDGIVKQAKSDLNNKFSSKIMAKNYYDLYLRCRNIHKKKAS